MRLGKAHFTSLLSGRNFEFDVKCYNIMDILIFFLSLSFEVNWADSVHPDLIITITASFDECEQNS